MMTTEELNDKPTGSNDGRSADLVERLRYWGGYIGFSPAKGTALRVYCLQAADRIAALEAQLAAADAMADDLIAHRGPWMHAMTVAAHKEPEEGDYWRHERAAFMTTLAKATAYRAIRGGGNG